MASRMRSPAFATRGVVAAPHYLATLAGVQVLQDGGNAIDAAIAANAVMMVVWPHMCGLGGDLFAQVYDGRARAHFALNASGRAAAGASWEKLRSLGHTTMPQTGVHSITVPGAVDGLFTLWERFGSLPMERLLRPAIEHARDGFPVTERTARAIERARGLLQQSPAAARVFLPDGSPPRPGDRFVQSDLARSFELLARQGRVAFYSGELGAALVQTIQAGGGAMSMDDLAAHRSDWVEPISTTFRGVEVFELPPNSQGLALLQMLNIVEPFDLAGMGQNTAECIHHLVEAKKLAFADRDRYITDPAFSPVPVARLGSKEYASQRRLEIDPLRAAAEYRPGLVDGDTIYLCAADRDGIVVSLIQSLFANFGSGVLVEGTGILLQNRGSGFSLDPNHVNRLEPRKRPKHTLMPAMAFRDGQPLLAFGTRGADGQPQTQLQLLVNLLVFGMEPQEALEAPRWVSGGPAAGYAPDALVLEQRIGADVAEQLRTRGHNVFFGADVDDLMGTAQLIRLDHERGLLIGAADPRGDSLALGY